MVRHVEDVRVSSVEPCALRWGTNMRAHGMRNSNEILLDALAALEEKFYRPALAKYFY